MIASTDIVIDHSEHRDHRFWNNPKIDHDEIRMTDHDQSETLITINQNGRSRSSEYATGLGLVLVQRFTHYLGGTVHMRSEVRKGTTVTLVLPFRRMAIKLPLAAPFRPASLHGLRVLVVDDDTLIRDIVSRLLRPHVKVVEVADGALQGLQRLSANQYDIVVTDLSMPGLSGLDLIFHYRAESVAESRLPFLLLTGDIEFEHQSPALPPFTGCLHKPIDEHALLCAIDQLVSGNPLNMPNSVPCRQQRAITLTPPPVLDLTCALAHFNGDVHVAWKDLRSFHTETLHLVDAGVELPAAAYLAHMHRLAHRLFGTGGSIGAKRLAQLANEFLAVKDGASFSQRKVLFANLYSELALFENAVLALARDTQSSPENS